MDLDCDVAVIGGGPAGARAAELLSMGGRRVVLLEQSSGGPGKLCGGLLTEMAQRALGVELPPAIVRPQARPPLEYHDPLNHLRLRYDPGYLNVDRAAFDAWLLERARLAGARLETGCAVSGWRETAEGVEVATQQGVLAARVVLDASGWRALSRRLAGLKPPPMLSTLQGTVACALPQDAMWAVYLSHVTPFYGWTIPLGGGRFLLGAGFRAGVRLAPPGAPPWEALRPFIDYLDTRGAKTQFVDAKPRGCPLTWVRGAHDLWWGEGRVFALGEAAGLVSPSSGGGIHYALCHAAALAEVLLGSDLFTPANAATPAGLERLRLRVRRKLNRALKRLSIACLKARVAARPPLRAVAARCLPFYLARRVERLH